MRFFLLILLLLPSTSWALNQTMLSMPKDKAYMNFALGRLLPWQRDHFKFPPKTPLLEELLLELDHWLVEGTPLYQLGLTHGVGSDQKPFQKIRLWVAPKLREKREFKGQGLPSSPVWFYELSSTGEECLLLGEVFDRLSAWCRRTRQEKYSHAWDEIVTARAPDPWNFPFPYLGQQVIRRVKGEEVLEVSFFKVGPHPSRMPKELLMPVFYFTRDALFPLSRVSTTKGGQMSVHYP